MRVVLNDALRSAQAAAYTHAWPHPLTPRLGPATQKEMGTRGKVQYIARLSDESRADDTSTRNFSTRSFEHTEEYQQPPQHTPDLTCTMA
ncbi:hypothetical protein PsYK624_136210 [Phanerochaete sordida]|uniref:Uncharacterized protein n=1 Tax=Phanerochaete sordida TaxID=48140 RepID=A0A9P3LK69_9APHY|nr:hypothetical protein PsYK624_136210 [Phanerochaete sordida]